VSIVRHGDDTRAFHERDPLIVCADSILSPDEASALLKLAEDRAPIAKETTNARRVKRVLLETLAGRPTPIVTRVRRRVSKLLGLPESHCEPPHVLRFSHGQQQHNCEDPLNSPGRGAMYLGGRRVATVVVHLTAPPPPGKFQVVFPKLEVAADAVMGSGLIWLDIETSGDDDPKTQHELALVAGEDFIQSCLCLWFRAHPIAEAGATSVFGRIASPAEAQSGGALLSKETSKKSSALRLLHHASYMSEGAPISAFAVEPEVNCPSPPAPDPCEFDGDELADFAEGGECREAVTSQHVADIIPEDEVFDSGPNETRLEIGDWSSNHEPRLDIGGWTGDEEPQFRPSIPFRVEDFEEVD